MICIYIALSTKQNPTHHTPPKKSWPPATLHHKWTPHGTHPPGSRFSPTRTFCRAFVPSLPLLVPSLVIWHDRLAPRRRRQSDSAPVEVEAVDGGWWRLIPMEKTRLKKKRVEIYVRLDLMMMMMMMMMLMMMMMMMVVGKKVFLICFFVHSCCFVFTMWRGYEVFCCVVWVLGCLKSTDYNNMLQFGKASKSDMQPKRSRLHSLKTANSTYILENKHVEPKHGGLVQMILLFNRVIFVVPRYIVFRVIPGKPAFPIGWIHIV